ncbi:hypothetical protein [Enterobacter genomosp. S]|uniref:hypothetical protein n=1 Tax=Enterobacter genomosp. S TaxID=2364151 RepID=UPI0013F4E288|nr:hypothetical protein [Enterobacter genomosp. S]
MSFNDRLVDLMAVLVFTKNFAVRKAIKSLYAEECRIYFFNNRLAFLVSATVFDKPCILIDTVHETSDNIRWIYTRLSKRGLARLTHFIAPKNVTAHSFLSVFRLVTSIKELKRIFNHASKVQAREMPCNFRNALFGELKKNLSEIHIEFLMNIYNPVNKAFRCSNRSDINKLYYLRCRLLLGTGIELKQLILMLTTNKISP